MTRPPKTFLFVCCLFPYRVSVLDFLLIYLLPAMNSCANWSASVGDDTQMKLGFRFI